MILTGRQCINCGSDQWNYPDRTEDRVKVTCVGCGKYIAHYPYDQLGDPKPSVTKGHGSSPEDQEPVQRRGADPSQGWFWNEAMEAKTRKQKREEKDRWFKEDGW